MNPLKEAAERAEAELIMQTLVNNNGNVSKSAKALKCDRKTLYNKLSRYGIANGANEGWISVNMKLPPVGSDEMYPESSDELIVFDGTRVFTGYFENREWVDRDGEKLDLKRPITHWKHLPDAPSINLKR